MRNLNAFVRKSGAALGSATGQTPPKPLSEADIQKVGSAEPPDVDVGWLPERDVAFWMLVAARHRDSGREEASFHLPYLFVDNPQAVLTGRATLFGCMAGGDAGAARALEILSTELVRAMQLCGVRSIAEISGELVSSSSSKNS